MRAYATKDGYVFWGHDAHDIVSQMRRSDFMTEHESNRAYIREVASRIRDMEGEQTTRGLFRATEEEFLIRLTELGMLEEVTADYECPIVHGFCSSRKDSCEGEHAYCWIKKQETAGSFPVEEDEIPYEDGDSHEND